MFTDSMPHRFLLINSLPTSDFQMIDIVETGLGPGSRLPV